VWDEYENSTPSHTEKKKMKRTAWVYVISVLLSALVLGVLMFLDRPLVNPPTWVFLLLTLSTTLMRLYHIVAPDHRSYEGSTIAFVAGVLLLPPWLFVFQVVIAQSIEWIWVRRTDPNSLKAWYLQPFNMAKCIIGGNFAYLAAILVRQLPIVSPHTLDLVVTSSIIIVYVATNQLLLGLALFIARGVSFREAGIFRDTLLIELPLACIGYVTFELFSRSPLTVIFTLAPIVLIYQVFMLPKVQDETMKKLEGMNKELTEAHRSVVRLNDELFRALAKVFDMRDPYVGGHAAQVAVYAVAIAEGLGLSPDQIELVRQSAFLHDIGKLAIPESILHKPQKLTNIEYEFIKKHAEIGADLIASTEGLSHLAPYIRHHHERWDGHGYPLGLAGNQIPLEARILNLCDAVESMASDRPYHRGMSMEEIVDEIRRCRGTQFDPILADALVELILQRGPSFVINSARSVTQQYAASLEANLSLTHNMFEWMIEKTNEKQSIPANKRQTAYRSTMVNLFPAGKQVVEQHRLRALRLEI
jgi:putative nucleotidyltransferase with HDIG domain